MKHELIFYYFIIILHQWFSAVVQWYQLLFIDQEVVKQKQYGRFSSFISVPALSCRDKWQLCEYDL